MISLSPSLAYDAGREHPVLHRLRLFIERILPWFDPVRQRERDRSVASTVRQADELSTAIRRKYTGVNERLSSRGRT